MLGWLSWPVQAIWIYNAVLMQSDSVKYALMQCVIFFLLQPFMDSLSKCPKHVLYNLLKSRSNKILQMQYTILTVFHSPLQYLTFLFYYLVLLCLYWYNIWSLLSEIWTLLSIDGALDTWSILLLWSYMHYFICSYVQS